MIDLFTTRRILVALALLGVFAAALPAAHGQLRVGADPVYEPRPIIAAGDEAIGWSEGNFQILILKGNVHIEQGLLRARMQQAVLWMTGTEAAKGKPLPVQIYGEGEVVVDKAGEINRPAKVLLDLKTQDAFKLKNASPMALDAAQDPFYRRAVAERDTIVGQATPRPSPTPPSLSNVNLASGPKREFRTIQAIPTQAPTERPEPVAPGAPGPRRFADRPKLVRITPRNTTRFDAKIERSGPDEQLVVITGGVQVYVDDFEQAGIIDMSTDRAVIWLRNVDAQGFLSGAESGEPTNAHIEVYLEGHVEIRRETIRGAGAGSTQTLKADQAYYDVTRNVAQLINAEVIATEPKLPNEIHLRAQEIRQVSANRFEATEAAIFASRLPSDPDLYVLSRSASLELREIAVRDLFGRQAVNEAGQPLTTTQLYGTADDLTLNVVDVPILYLPSVEGDLRDPLGPLEQVRFRNDRVFGFGVLVDWDMFKLLGMEAPQLTKWRLETDYMSERGPALGTTFQTAGVNLFGVPGKYQTFFKGYVIHDEGRDILGPFRQFPVPDPWRGRALLRHRQEIYPDLTVLAHFNYLSDRNFLEQYYKREFDEDFLQDTFIYLKEQQEFWAWSLEAQFGLRDWVTQTEWLPKGSGYLIGVSPWDRLTYFARGSAGYARQTVTSDLPPGYLATPFPTEFDRVHPLPPSSDLPHYDDQSLGRFDIWQELDLPLDAGPFKIVPYALLDLSYYTTSLTGDEVARIYGGGGARASIPFTRVYPDVCSDLFNVNGIAHKIVVSGDYRYVQSSENFRELPLLDRLDDDATDQARRDLRLFRLMTAAPGSVEFNLATSPLYDPQLYALRRGLETSLENIDDLHVVRMGVRQRWQTKRGFPGHEHIIDWMILDLRGTAFPEADRDNFGHLLAFLEYDYTWHIGDRTTIASSGWMDPYEDGPRVWNIGVFLNRPERINYYIGFRSIDPVDSKAVITNMSYVFSPKWAMSVGSTYDFGQSESLGSSLVFTRIGTDLQVSIGIHADPLRDNFGVTFEIVPSLAPGRVRGIGGPMLANGPFAR